MMNTIPPTSSSISHEELDALLASPAAQEISQRFVEGFVPMMNAKITSTVKSVLAEEFPSLVSDDQFIQRVIARLTPDVITEQRFVFLALNPKFPAL